MSVAHREQSQPTGSAGCPLLEAFERLGVQVLFRRNEELYGQDEPADRFYLIQSGVVRTSRLTSDGRRQIGEFYYPGDIFGLEVGPEHRFAAEAATDCQVQVVRRTAVRTFAGEAAVDRAILAATQRELERLQEHLMLLGRKGALERVAFFLMSLASPDRELEVNLPMGRQDMADYLGLTIETVSRMLTQLQGAAILNFPSTRRFKIRKWAALETLAA